MRRGTPSWVNGPHAFVAVMALAFAPASWAAAPSISTCSEMARERWPATAQARETMLARMDALRENCVDNAPFLAMLGALWLEQGDATQALLWLERSLMIEPGAQGTAADHALALAALGERTALNELAARWREREDIPAALRARLETARRGAASKSPGGGPFSLVSGTNWTWRRSLSVLKGHETNLDHSPRLSEITLSSPDGPIDLPLAVPFVPRAGRAWVGEGAVQAFHSPQPGTLWQFGVQLGGRHSGDEPGTDTHQLQLTASLWRQHEGWRSQWQVGALSVNGPLSEPYRTATFGFAAEKDWNGCWNRLGLDAEWRQQRLSSVANALTTALQGGVNCGLGSTSGWTSGLALRLALDSPRNPDRPGGQQAQLTVGARAAGPIGLGVRVELAARQTWLRDGEGYSALLENNATRRQRQTQFSLELSRPLREVGLSGLDAVLQLQSLQQFSNIKLFEHKGISAFGGLRLDW